MREPLAEFDPERLMSLLDEHAVEYVLVGGYAGRLHGAIRSTLDLDVVPDWAEANLHRLCTMLRSVDAKAITGPPCEDEAITPEVLMDREIMTWSTLHGRLDTMVGIPDAEGLPVVFQDLLRHAARYQVGAANIAVAGLDDVIRSKEFASRAKDTKALPELRRLRDEQTRARAAPRSD